MRKQQPKVIFLDAVGTIFGDKDSVGKVYSQIAREFRVEVAANIIDRNFFFHALKHPQHQHQGMLNSKISLNGNFNGGTTFLIKLLKKQE